MRTKIIVLALLATFVALAAYLWYDRETEPVEAPPAPAVEAPPPEVPVEPQYPVPETGPAPGEEPLPEIDDSDVAMRDALTGVFGSTAGQMLVPDSLLRRIVATIDALPRQKLAARMRPVNPAPGKLVVEESEGGFVLKPENYERYEPLVQLVESADPKQIVDMYLRFYPRFQEAYEQLGYPKAHFNDRFVAVIDDLLATPEIEEPIALQRPNVFYEYVDPELEARSVGQKTLLRMGPENAAAIKAKLRDVRTELTSRAPANAP
jgi:hypothetical protein